MKKEDLSIYIIGRNTSYISLANALNMKNLYPEFADNVIYFDDNSFDNTKELLNKYDIIVKDANITHEDIDKFKPVNLFAEMVFRNSLTTKRVLEDCKTKYALIMHADLFILKKEFLYTFIEYMDNYSVMSIDKPKYKTEVEQQMLHIKKKINKTRNKELIDIYEFYLLNIHDTSVNNIWNGLLLIDVELFKSNNLILGDRLDYRNIVGINENIINSMQDFQSYIDYEINNIPGYKTANFLSAGQLVKDGKIFHFDNISKINTVFFNTGKFYLPDEIMELIEKDEININPTYEEGAKLFESYGVDLRKYLVRYYIREPLFKKGLKIISKNSGLPTKQVLKALGSN